MLKGQTIDGHTEGEVFFSVLVIGERRELGHHTTLRRRDHRKLITTHTSNTTSSLLAPSCTAEQRLTVSWKLTLSNLIYNSTWISDIINRWFCPQWHFSHDKL